MLIFFNFKYFIIECGGVFSGSSGVITSPNYPQNYDSNHDCRWIIQANDGETIQVKKTQGTFS